MKKSILIIDNDKASIRLFEILLHRHGYTTIVSIDGMDTLQLAQKYRPDLIIMDIKLPSISGIELTKILKENGDLSNIPVLAVTSHALVGDEQSILKAGCDGYLSKPISVSSFLIEIKKHLGLRIFNIIAPLKTGHEEIDSEHEEIVLLLNEFTNSQDAGDSQACADKLTEIFETLKTHIKNEERIMEEHGYNGLEVQKKKHVGMINKLDDLILSWNTENNKSSFTEHLRLLFIEDFFDDDMAFADHLQLVNY